MKKTNYDNGWSSHPVSCYCPFLGPLCSNTFSPEQRDSVSRTDTGWKSKAIILWGYRKNSCASCLSEIEIYFIPTPRASRPVVYSSPSPTPLFGSSLSQGFHGLTVKANQFSFLELCEAGALQRYVKQQLACPSSAWYSATLNKINTKSNQCFKIPQGNFITGLKQVVLLVAAMCSHVCLICRQLPQPFWLKSDGGIGWKKIHPGTTCATKWEQN